MGAYTMGIGKADRIRAIWNMIRFPTKIFGISIVCSYLLGLIFYDSIYGLLLAPFCFLFFRYVLNDIKNEKVKIQIQKMFGDMILSLASTLQAGYSVEQGMNFVIEELLFLYGEEAIIVVECNRIVKHMETNGTVETAFTEMAKNIKLKEAVHFSETFRIGKRVGGDLTHIIRDTSMILSDIMDSEREIRTISAAKKFEFQVMCMMPLLMVGYVKMTSPGYFEPLYHNLFGNIVMTTVLTLVILIYLIGQKMIHVEV